MKIDDLRLSVGIESLKTELIGVSELNTRAHSTEHL